MKVIARPCCVGELKERSDDLKRGYSRCIDMYTYVFDDHILKGIPIECDDLYADEQYECNVVSKKFTIGGFHLYKKQTIDISTLTPEKLEQARQYIVETVSKL